MAGFFAIVRWWEPIKVPVDFSRYLTHGPMLICIPFVHSVQSQNPATLFHWILGFVGRFPVLAWIITYYNIIPNDYLKGSFFIPELIINQPGLNGHTAHLHFSDVPRDFGHLWRFLRTESPVQEIKSQLDRNPMGWLRLGWRIPRIVTGDIFYPSDRGCPLIQDWLIGLYPIILNGLNKKLWGYNHHDHDISGIDPPSTPRNSELETSMGISSGGQSNPRYRRFRQSERLASLARLAGFPRVQRLGTITRLLHPNDTRGLDDHMVNFLLVHPKNLMLLLFISFLW